MTKPEEERQDHGDGLISYQRPCPVGGCDRGLIYYPARFCGGCSGSGWKVRWARTIGDKEFAVSGPYSEIPWAAFSEAARPLDEEDW